MHVVQAVNWYEVCVWYIDLQYERDCDYYDACYYMNYTTKKSLYDELINVGFTADQAIYGIENCSNGPSE